MSEKSWALDPIWRESIKEGPTFRTTANTITEQGYVDLSNRVKDKVRMFLARFGRQPDYILFGHSEVEMVKSWTILYGRVGRWSGHGSDDLFFYGLPVVVVDRDSFLGAGC